MHGAITARSLSRFGSPDSAVLVSYSFSAFAVACSKLSPRRHSTVPPSIAMPRHAAQDISERRPCRY
jgi:hypothetical protein